MSHQSKARKLANWPRGKPCPCESGLVYSECCLPRGVKWQMDGRGAPYRTVAITPEYQGVIFDSAEPEFRRIFRRKPRGADRAFPLTYVISEDDVYDNFSEAAAKAGIDPALIYAFQRTGRIITKDMKDRLPVGYVDEWEDAIDEYYLLQAEGAELPAFERALACVREEAERLPYIFGKVLVDVNERPSRKMRGMGFASVFAMYCVARAAKSFNSAVKLRAEHAGEDCLTLVRSIYEGYLHIVGALVIPEEIEEVQRAKAGLIAGTHIHRLTKKGRPDYRLAYDSKTGERLRTEISTVRLAFASPYAEDIVIHEQLYSYLSRFVHPHLMALPNFLGAEGFTSKSRLVTDEAFILAVIVCAMTLDAISRYPIPSQLRNDVHRYLKHVRKALLAFFQSVEHVAAWAPFQEALRTRVSKLGVSDPPLGLRSPAV